MTTRLPHGFNAVYKFSCPYVLNRMYYARSFWKTLFQVAIDKHPIKSYSENLRSTLELTLYFGTSSIDQTHFKNLAAFAARFLKCIWPFYDVAKQRVKVCCGTGSLKNFLCIIESRLHQFILLNVLFLYPWKYQKIFGLLTFSGGTEIEH